MNVTSHFAASPATEYFDAETLALLNELNVESPEFGGVDLNIVFGTPLEMYEPFATAREAGLADERECLEQFFARRHAARDILADVPSITARVRERLVDVLVPYAARLRTAPSAAVPLPIAA